MQIYVSGNVRRSGDGSMEHPFRTIQEAALVAKPGDDVLVAPGIYREWVRPAFSGTDSQRIKYVSMVKGEAVITGAERLTGWEKFENIWRVRIPNSFFGDYNPYTDVVFGDWFFASLNNPHTGEIYIDNRSMYEVFDLSACMHPQIDKRSWDPDFTKYVWFTAQEGAETVIYANFDDRDPNEENVEFAVRRACFYPEKEGVNNITLRGFTVRCAATQWAPPTAVQIGMIGPHWSK
ncbi:MAG: DUF1565 domain-containing protein, partial [Butyrivibrio sp.]|nr:DUF1565 domain-containing protein [Butyrivibrio sp.]